MKRILIIGSKSFIGNVVKNELAKSANYKAEIFDIEGIDPEIIEYKDYDAVIWAESVEPSRKADRNPEFYKEVNSKLAFHTAYIARACNVKQFVVLSTLDVYGTDSKVLDENSTPTPETEYAKSKLEADSRIQQLENEAFKVSIVRLPSEYADIKKSGFDKFLNYKGNRRKERVDSNKACKLIKEILDDEKKGLFVLTQ